MLGVNIIGEIWVASLMAYLAFYPLMGSGMFFPSCAPKPNAEGFTATHLAFFIYLVFRHFSPPNKRIRSNYIKLNKGYAKVKEQGLYTMRTFTNMVIDTEIRCKIDCKDRKAIRDILIEAGFTDIRFRDEDEYLFTGTFC